MDYVSIGQRRKLHFYEDSEAQAKYNKRASSRRNRANVWGILIPIISMLSAASPIYFAILSMITNLNKSAVIAFATIGVIFFFVGALAFLFNAYSELFYKRSPLDSIVDRMNYKDDKKTKKAWMKEMENNKLQFVHPYMEEMEPSEENTYMYFASKIVDLFCYSFFIFGALVAVGTCLAMAVVSFLNGSNFPVFMGISAGIAIITVIITSIFRILSAFEVTPAVFITKKLEEYKTNSCNTKDKVTPSEKKNDDNILSDLDSNDPDKKVQSENIRADQQYNNDEDKVYAQELNQDCI